MQTHCFVKWVIIYSCALAWAFTPIVSNAQETAAVLRAPLSISSVRSS